MIVLVVEPEPAVGELARVAVERFGYRAIVAQDGTEAWQRVLADEPGVVVTALQLAGLDGFELCRRIRDCQASSYCYVVALTAADDQESLALAMASGADDFLALPIQPEALHARLQVAERFALLYRQLGDRQAELDRTSRALRASARTDPLTQLWNRLQLNDDLDLFQGQLRRYGHRYAAAIVDLDRFRAFNEMYGQLAGDEALRVVAETASQQLRTGDRAYRHGGDELILLLPEQTIDSARVAVDRIREAVDRLALQHAGNPPWNILTLSAGVAAFRADEDASYDTLIGRAEAALQRAKDAGGNRVAFEEGGKGG